MKWAKLSERERDALVAEKVMGWQSKPCDLEETGGELTIYGSGDACCPRCGSHEHINSFEHGTIPPPHYTTSMDAACTIPEYPTFFGANTEIACVPKSYWRCHIDFHQRGEHYHGFGDTPAEAVCVAFLRAVGVEIEV